MIMKWLSRTYCVGRYVNQNHFLSYAFTDTTNTLGMDTIITSSPRSLRMSFAQTTAICTYAYIAQLGWDEDVEAERGCSSFRLHCTPPLPSSLLDHER